MADRAYFIVSDVDNKKVEVTDVGIGFSINRSIDSKAYDGATEAFYFDMAEINWTDKGDAEIQKVYEFAKAHVGKKINIQFYSTVQEKYIHIVKDKEITVSDLIIGTGPTKTMTCRTAIYLK